MPRQRKQKPPLVNAAPEECFWTCDGRIFANLKELSDGLKEMNDEVFSYHCNKNKNDFAVWIEQALKNEKLAKKIAKTKNRLVMAKKIDTELKNFAF